MIKKNNNKKINSHRVKSWKQERKMFHLSEELVFNSNPVKNSALKKAIEYTKDCWDDLFTFIDKGFVEMTNNIAERYTGEIFFYHSNLSH